MTSLGSLCTGTGALEMAVEEVFRDVSISWMADNSEASQRLLGVRHPGVPNFGDLKSINWNSVPRVDILTAGIPCQPWSAAGKGKGNQDDRDLSEAFLTAVRGLRPKLVILENVAGFKRRGMPGILGPLAGMGYDARWGSVRAADAGAPHRRERVFVLAYPKDLGLEWVRSQRKRGGGSQNSCF